MLLQTNMHISTKHIPPPLLSHDMRGLMKTKSNHVYILFEQP